MNVAGRIVGVDHVQITVPNESEDAARAFYCGTLGLTEIEKPAELAGRGGFWLKAGASQVHVGVEAGSSRSSNSKAHVAYEVDDLEAWRNRLENEGVEVIDGVPIPHYRRFEFRDPFGNRVEFLQRV